MKSLLVLTSSTVALISSALPMPDSLPKMAGCASVITGWNKEYQNPLFHYSEALLDVLPPNKSSNIFQTKAVKVDASYKVTNDSVITAQAIDKHFRGVLENKGSFVIEQAREYNICPIFLSAVIIHESAHGTSKFARERNNVAGIYLKGKYHTFDSVEDCIKFTAKLLGGKMYAGGRNNTIGKVQEVYCPVGAGNDPRGVNSHWRSGVIHHMVQIWGDENIEVKI